MTDREKKERFLWRYRILIERIEECTIRIEALRGVSGMNYSGMPSSGEANDLTNKVARIMKEEEKKKDITAKSEIVYQEIDSVISALEDVEERKVLFLRFLTFKEAEEIGDILGYSRSSVFNRIDSAMYKIQLPNVWTDLD